MMMNDDDDDGGGTTASEDFLADFFEWKVRFYYPFRLQSRDIVQMASRNNMSVNR